MGKVRFEQKYAVDPAFRFAPNIDVVLAPSSGPYEVLAIECKFTEAYSSRGHAALAPKYLDVADVWDRLPATKQLARGLVGEETAYEHLHPAQLVKHILGLTQQLGRGKYRLMYLWYDALGEDGARHRREIERFSEVVTSDGVKFHAVSYQELIVRLAEYREAHPEYVAYLSERYL